jgi:hypothetical protein
LKNAESEEERIAWVDSIHRVCNKMTMTSITDGTPDKVQGFTLFFALLLWVVVNSLSTESRYYELGNNERATEANSAPGGK